MKKEAFFLPDCFLQLALECLLPVTSCAERRAAMCSTHSTQWVIQVLSVPAAGWNLQTLLVRGLSVCDITWRLQLSCCAQVPQLCRFPTRAPLHLLPLPTSCATPLCSDSVRAALSVATHEWDVQCLLCFKFPQAQSRGCPLSHPLEHSSSFVANALLPFPAFSHCSQGCLLNPWPHQVAQHLLRYSEWDQQLRVGLWPCSWFWLSWPLQCSSLRLCMQVSLRPRLAYHGTYRSYSFSSFLPSGRLLDWRGHCSFSPRSTALTAFWKCECVCVCV